MAVRMRANFEASFTHFDLTGILLPSQQQKLTPLWRYSCYLSEAKAPSTRPRETCGSTRLHSAPDSV